MFRVMDSTGSLMNPKGKFDRTSKGEQKSPDAGRHLHKKTLKRSTWKIKPIMAPLSQHFIYCLIIGYYYIYAWAISCKIP